MASQHPRPTLCFFLPCLGRILLPQQRTDRTRGMQRYGPFCVAKTLRTNGNTWIMSPNGICDSHRWSYTQWSFNFWKDCVQPFCTSDWHQDYTHAERTQPTAYCSTGSMTGSQWKFNEQSDDLVFRWVSNLFVTPDKSSSTSLLTFSCQAFL